MSHSTQIGSDETLLLLQQLIAIPSLSKQESKTADAIEGFLEKKGVQFRRVENNVWARNLFFDPNKPSILLNSHHDTVPANAAYTLDPHQAQIIGDKLFGLGSTDAGASLVCLLSCFVHFYQHQDLPYNLVIAATAEEEISGTNGIELLFKDPFFAGLFQHTKSFAIVGEPTELQLAIAEKGLLVLDCNVAGRAGHAAREEGENAIYKAIKAIDWFQHFRFPKISDSLGEVKMTVTAISTQNKAHNIIPASCDFVVDIRVTDVYTHEEILDIIADHVDLQCTPRSTRLRSSFIPTDHPIVKAGMVLGKTVYGSPTSSDQALIPLPSLKCGPGFSGQSHSADEYIELTWIPEALAFYVNWLEKLFHLSSNNSSE
jgi:acetylornithine deacetylase